MSLKDKKILITAGPTWVAIDPIRAITNIATGQTGKILARLASAKGARVRLFLSSAPAFEKIKGVSIKSFRYFQDLSSRLGSELKMHKYDCIIHNAAVSDFLVKNRAGRKIDSRRKGFKIGLARAPKIISEIRKNAPRSILVMFKLEVNVSCAELIRRARRAQKKAGADFVVANTFKGRKLKSFVYNHKSMLAKADSRRSLARKLLSILEKSL